MLSHQNGYLALVMSLIVHMVVLWSPTLHKPAIKPEPTLEVYLKPLLETIPAAPSPPTSELAPREMIEQTDKEKRANSEKSVASKMAPVKPQQKSEQPVLSGPPSLSSQLKQKLAQQVQAFYPDEYVQQRIEGEVVLRLFVEPSTGEVIAIRVEIPSRYPLFNEAARQAALSSVTALGAGMGSEVLLPVKFRLGRL